MRDPYAVHVWAVGHYAGFYELPSRDAATADAADRRRSLGVLGFSYYVAPLEPEEAGRGVRLWRWPGDIAVVAPAAAADAKGVRP